MEIACAREVFERLGAAPDLAAISALERSGAAGATARRRGHGLTERELQVLRLIAKGCTNKTIARELSLSEKTIDRHVSNIFAKTAVLPRVPPRPRSHTSASCSEPGEGKLPTPPEGAHGWLGRSPRGRFPYRLLRCGISNYGSRA